MRYTIESFRCRDTEKLVSCLVGQDGILPAIGNRRCSVQTNRNDQLRIGRACQTDTRLQATRYQGRGF
jgi:hypothetical protein